METYSKATNPTLKITINPKCFITFHLNQTPNFNLIPQASALNFNNHCLTVCCHALLSPVSAGSSSLLSPTHQEPTHPYYPNKPQAMIGHNGTPVPPRYLMRGHHGAALSPTVFATDKGIPVSLNHYYTGVASSSNAVHIQQSLLDQANHGSPNYTGFTSPNAQFQPGYYSPGEHAIS